MGAQKSKLEFESENFGHNLELASASFVYCSSLIIIIEVGF